MNIQRLIVGAMRLLPPALIRRMAGDPWVIDGFTLDPHIHVVANMAARQATDAPSLETRRAEARAAFEMLNAPRRAGVHVIDTDVPGPAGRMPIRQYQPQGKRDAEPAILFFHQGGLVILDLDTCDPFCTILADECQARVISLDYRLCPEHAFPAAIDDAMALWDYVQENAETLGIDPTRVALAGDSAGGLIAADLCHLLKARGGTQPAAQLLIYPWVTSDLNETGSLVSCAEAFPLNQEVMHYFRSQVFPDDKGNDDPLANPLEQDLTGLPPAVVATAGFDPIRDQGNA